MSDSTLTCKDEHQQLTSIDRELILLTQSGLPRVSKPYHALADTLGISADEVMMRLSNMIDSGVIRRIAAVPNHYKLGFKTNGMTVWDVPDENIKELGKIIGALPFVSHCYQRPRYLPTWRYNLFAMVHGKNKEDVNKQINEIKNALGSHCRANDVLYSTKILKKTGLRIKQ